MMDIKREGKKHEKPEKMWKNWKIFSTYPHI